MYRCPVSVARMANIAGRSDVTPKMPRRPDLSSGRVHCTDEFNHALTRNVCCDRDQSRRCYFLVAIGGIADIQVRWSPEGSVANDPKPKCRDVRDLVAFEGQADIARTSNPCPIPTR